MIGSLPSWPMRFCDGQTTVVVVPAVGAIVVTGAKVVDAGAVEAVVVVGGTEVDGVMASGVDAEAVVVPAAVVVFGVTIVVISALKQPWMLGLTVYTPMPESTGSSMTIVTQRASKTNGAGNKICLSSLTTCRSNVVVSSLEEMIITVTICMLLLGLKDTDDTCGDGWPSLGLRSKVIVGFSGLWSAGKLTTHGEEGPPYFWNSTEELSFVTVTLSKGMIGSLPSWPMRSCDGQTTVVVVPAVGAIVVTGAKVVDAGAVEAVVVIGGTEVDGVMASGVDAEAVVVPAAVVVFGVTIVVISALKQPWMLGLTLYTPMLESTGSSMTIVTQRASKTNGAGNKICPSSLTTCRSNVVVSSLEEMIITVTICMLLLGLKDTDDTCSDGRPSLWLRSKVIVGFSALWSAGKLTTHGEERPPYFWNSTEDLSFVTVTLSSGMIGSLPSWPMRSCDAQTTVVVVPAVVAIVVTGARVVVAGAVEAVVVVGGTEVDGVMPSGVDSAAVVVPAAAVVFGVTIVVISALKQP